MNKFFDRKKRELNDVLIASSLRKAADDYENGEIAEVQDVLIDIINAINSFDATNNK